LKKKSTNTKNQSASFQLSNIFQTDWFFLLILTLFWFVIFRELLTGSRWLYDDFPYVYYPGKYLMAVSLAKGIFPMWNPFAFSGTPFFADPQIGILYPLNYIMKFFVSNDALSPLVVQNIIVLHFLIASVICFYLAKEFKLNRLASFVFAMIFTYSSFMIIHMIHMNLLESLIWMPLALLLILKFNNTGRYFYIILAGFSMTFSIFGGYPQTFFFNFIFLGGFVLYLCYKNYKSKTINNIYKLIGAYIAIVVIAAGISSVQLISTSEFSDNSERQSISYDFGKQGSVHPLDIFTLFTPKIFGTFNWNESSEDLQYWSVAKAGGHQEGAWMFTISTLYLSLLVIFIFIPAIRYYWNNKINSSFPLIFLLVFGVMALLFSFGGNFFVHKLFFDIVPFFNKFRNPGHVTFLFTFCFGLIAAFGIDRLTSDTKNFFKYFNKKYLLYCAGFVLLFVLCSYMGVFKSFFPLSEKAEIGSWITKQVNIFLVFSILYLGTFFLFINNKININTFFIFTILVLSIDLYSFGFDQNNGTQSPQSLYSQNASQMTQFRPSDPNDQFRVNMREGGNMLMQRQQGLIDGIQLIEGVNVLTLDRKIPPSKTDTSNKQSLDLLNVKYKISVAGNRAGLVENIGYMPRAKMFYDYKVISDKDGIINYMKTPEFDYNKTVVLEKNPDINIQPLDFSANNSVAITEYNLNSIKLNVQTDKNGILLLSEIYYPAWKAFVDGKETEIIRADYCLRAITISQGSHSIEFVYDSEGFNKGKTISLSVLVASLAGLVVFGFIAFKKK
jgi:hypothetical protein